MPFLFTIFVSMSSARAQLSLLPPIRPAGTASVFEGVVTTRNGRPLPNATVYLYELPPSPGQTDTYGDATTVVTDDSGRFKWNVPAGININLDRRNVPPQCWVLAADRTAWKLDLRLPPRSNENSQRRQVLESAVTKCDTSWIRRSPSVMLPDDTPLISVIAPDVSVVNLTIHGPDGQPLRGHEVQVFTGGNFFSGVDVAAYDGTTDASGRLRLRWFAGLYQLSVFVPGVGFGSTGIFEALPNAESSPAIPPLAAFGQVSGFVAPTKQESTTSSSGDSQETVEPGAAVSTDDYGVSEYSWYQPSTTIDKNGRWMLTDMMPGDHRIVTHGASGEIWHADVVARAGEKVAGVRLNLRDPTVATTQATEAMQRAAGAQTATLRGIATDTAGNPLPSTVIYAVYSVRNGINGIGVQKSVADDLGRYEFRDVPIGPNGYSRVRLIGSHSGFAPAESDVSAKADATGSDVQCNLVLSAVVSKLTVLVLRNGRPVANANVRLTPPGYSRFWLLGYDIGSAIKEYGEANRLVSPVGETGLDGRVEFTDIAPGVWDIRASDDSVGKSFFPRSGNKAKTISYGTARDIAVASGKNIDFALNIFPPAPPVAFRAVDPAGRAPANPALNLALGPTPNWGSTAVNLDATGSGESDFFVPGIRRVTGTFRDVASRWFPAADEPNYTGSAVIAVSPSVIQPGPVLITASKRYPGSIRVQVVGTTGKPLRGATIFAKNRSGGARYAGSADKKGILVFSDLPAGTFLLSATAREIHPAPPLGQAGDAFPNDSDLTGVTRIGDQTITVQAGRETPVVLRAEPLGYIRGRLQVRTPMTDLALINPLYSPDMAKIHLDSTSGEFVAGPFPAGKAWISLARVPLVSHSGEPWWNVYVKIDPGKVTHVSLAPTGISSGATGDAMVMERESAGSSYGAKPLSGSVFLPDGVTPAIGAYVALSMKQNWAPAAMAQTDTTGRLTTFGGWDPSHDLAVMHRGPAPDDPSGPVLVAWLPGANGAVTMPYIEGQPARFVLPESHQARGRVRVGGEGIASIESTFRVLAAYQGKGRLSPILSVQTTPQADGSFVLAGLTPGVYRVQATRDEIWVSDVQTITIGERNAPDLTLDIPEPGLAMDLRLTDSAGKPIPHAWVSVTRPDGPLTDTVWPKTFESDAGGCVRLEGLIAGQETITVYAPGDGDASTLGSENVTGRPIAVAVFEVPKFAAGAPPIAKVIAAKP